MDKLTSSSDLERALEEAAMDNGWVDVSDAVEEASKKDSTDEDSPPTDNIMTCEVCQVNFTGIAPYEQHILGNKHKKKLVKQAMKKKYGPKYLELLNSKELVNETPSETTNSENDDVVVMKCDVCNKICTGLISYKLHMKGRSHQKQLQKLDFIEKLKENPEFLQDEKVLDNSLYDDMPQVKPFASCDTCNKKFSGPQAFRDHLCSGYHKKRLDMENLTKKLTGTGDYMKDETVNETAESFGSGDGFARCQMCEKTFTGPIPYQQHLISDTHKKKLKKSELAETMEQLSLDDEKAGTFHCKECKRSFCIPDQFVQHMKSSSHTKRKSRQEMLRKLQDEYPEMEIQPVTDYADDNLENEIHLPDDSSVLICKVCHKSFSGPQSANAHFTSQKHEKAKKLLLLARQQKLEHNKE